MSEEPRPYASRGGEKLAAALDAFGLDPAGRAAADLGASVGGFVDVLRRRGAEPVHALDTAYGLLAWRLRRDPGVVVHERTNALRFDPWGEIPGFAGCGLVTLDLGWTRQQRALPAARRWLADAEGRIVTLIKPPYEQSGHARPRGGVLADAEAERILARVLAETIPGLGLHVLGSIESPIRGGGKRRKRPGNAEYLALLAPGPDLSGPASAG